MLKFRKRGLQIAGILVVAGIMATPGQSFAQDNEFFTRFIRIHPEGPNNQINDTAEARGILNGTVIDVIKNEDLTGTIITVDVGGGVGSYDNDQSPYLNGVNDTGMVDFLQYVSGTITIPAGDWTVGCGSDDGCFLNLPGVVFDTTNNENGAAFITDGDGEVIYNGTRGHGWTAGSFTASEEITTGFEAGFFERGGGDSFEVAYVDAIYDPDADGALNEFMAGGFELDNGDFGDWKLTDVPFAGSGGDPSDANGDGAVNADDYATIADNWGNPFGFDNLFALAQGLSAPAGAATSSVPEPTSLTLLVSALAMLFSVRRRCR